MVCARFIFSSKRAVAHEVHRRGICKCVSVCRRRRDGSGICKCASVCRLRQEGSGICKCASVCRRRREGSGICKCASVCRRRRDGSGRKYARERKALSPDSVGSSPNGRALNLSRKALKEKKSHTFFRRRRHKSSAQSKHINIRT